MSLKVDPSVGIFKAHNYNIPSQILIALMKMKPFRRIFNLNIKIVTIEKRAKKTIHHINRTSSTNSVTSE